MSDEEDGDQPPRPFTPKVKQMLSPGGLGFPAIRRPSLLSKAVDPELPPRSSHSPRIGPVAERTEEVVVNGRRVQVTAWEPKDGNVDLHVVYLGMPLYMPWSMQKSSVELLARFVCGQVSAKIFALSEASVSPDVLAKPLADVEADIVRLIGALPLKRSFVLVDNSSGLGTGVLWQLQDRLAGAVVINPMGWFAESFLGGEEHQRLLHTARAHAASFRSRDVAGAAQLVSSLLFSDGASDVKNACEQYRQAIATSPSTFWSFHARIADWCLEEATPRYEALPELSEVPTVLVRGSHAPDRLVLETVFRLQRRITNSTVEVIPDSKQWWETEGKEQRMTVATLLLRTLRQAGDMSSSHAQGSEVPAIVPTHSASEIDVCMFRSPVSFQNFESLDLMEGCGKACV